MILDMVMVYVHFQMDINMKENGVKVKNMDVGQKYFQMDIDTMEYSKMAKQSHLHQNKLVFLLKQFSGKIE